MLKVRICSDLHCEFWNYNKFEKMLNRVIPPLDDDKKTTLVVSGDCGTYTNYNSTYKPFFQLVSKRFKHVIIVPGNHSLYSSGWWGREKEFWAMNKVPSNVHYLDNDHVVIDDVVFIGSCLWTNFDNENPLAMFHAARKMNDFDLIMKRNYAVYGTYGQVINSNKVLPEDTVERHFESITYVKLILDIFTDMKCFVVTHHAPSGQSVKECYRGDLLNYAYYSDLDEFILDNPQIKYWTHGHCHDSFSYEIGDTKVICNPFGYINNIVNKEYDHNLVVEI